MPKEGTINNPTGKGGFGDNPENRVNGKWTKDTSISYWYNYILRLPVDDFQSFIPETIAQRLALNAIIQSINDLPYLKEVTDRTEGRAQSTTDITSGGEKINPPATIVFMDSEKNEH